VPTSPTTLPAQAPASGGRLTLPLPGFLGGARSLTERSLVVALLLCAIVAVGAIARFEVAGDRPGAASADQRSYVRLAGDLRAYGSYGDSSMHQPFHWAPGAPAVFAVADALSGHSVHGRPEINQRAALHAEAVVGTGTILAAFALAVLLAGAWAGLLAALVVALYPPLIDSTAYLLSEPLGAFAITAALATVVWAWRRRAPWAFAVAGGALGLACLVRADVLLAALLLPLLGGVLLGRRHGWRRGASRACAMLLGSAAMIVPWSAYASTTAGHFIPITDGGAGTLFVATYLPGHGTIFGLKRALAAEVHRAHPYTRKEREFRIPEALVLDTVAARHPNLPREAALRKEALHNLRVYALGRPLSFASMVVSKLWRMWSEYYRGTHRPEHTSTLWEHRVIVGLALIGLLAGLIVRKRRALGLVLFAIVVTTALDVFFVAEPRHAFRLLPALVAGGAAGWWLLLSGRRAGARAPAPPPSPPEARSAA
jgi:hypothetical protein